MDLLIAIQEMLSRIRHDPEFSTLFHNDPHLAVRSVFGMDTDPAVESEIVERTKNALAAEEAEDSIKDVWRTV